MSISFILLLGIFSGLSSHSIEEDQEYFLYGDWQVYLFQPKCMVSNYEIDCQFDVYLPIPAASSRQQFLGLDHSVPRVTKSDMKVFDRRKLNRLVRLKRSIRVDQKPDFECSFFVRTRSKTLNRNKITRNELKWISAPERRKMKSYLSIDHLDKTCLHKLTEFTNNACSIETDPMTSAESIFIAVIEHLQYSRQNMPKGTSDTFDSKSGECVDYSDLFSICCRIKGIPARIVVGFQWLEQIAGRNEAGWDNHVWAEFWIPEVGWIPCDPSLADGNGYYRAEYFGNIGNQMLELTYDINQSYQLDSTLLKNQIIQTYLYKTDVDQKLEIDFNVTGEKIVPPYSNKIERMIKKNQAD